MMSKILVTSMLLGSINIAYSISNETEMSLIQAGGNSVSETFNLKTLSNIEKGKRDYSFGGHYTLVESDVTDDNGDTEKVVSARNWDANAAYEQELSKVLSGIFSIKYEGDEFAGIKQRENADILGKHFFAKNDKVKSFFELGFRYTVERTTERDKDGEDVFFYNKGKVYFERNQKISDSLSYKFWIEYLPNFTRGDDYQISYEPSLILALDKTFSLKSSYKGVYDNEPNVEGNEYTDFTFTTSVLAKF